MINKKNRIFIIIIFLFFIFLTIVFPTIVINKTNKTSNNIKVIEDEYKISKKVNVYSIIDLLRYKTNSENYSNNKVYLYLENNNSILNDGSIILHIDEKLISNTNLYKISISDKDNNIYYNTEINDKTVVNIGKLEDEGKYNFTIELYENGKIIYSVIQKIYYVIPYKKQFAQEISNNGVATHYYGPENYTLSGTLLKNIGTRYIRTDFPMSKIKKENDNYNFECLDEWVKDVEKNDIKIIAILNSNPTIESEKNLKNYCDFYLNIKKRYPTIKDYEVMNEPNYIYINEKMIDWYGKVLEKLNGIKDNNNICIGGTATGGTEGRYIKSLEFYDLLNKTGRTNNCNNYAFHNYDSRTLKKIINEHYNKLNTYGGFNYINITEYGSSSADIGEQKQAEDNVKQTVLTQQKCKYTILYSFWSYTEDENNWADQLGILYNDYTPKPAYYSMKNYYQNTNGAEYIGQVNIANGIEAHVYDKDGKPKIIAWATDTNKPVTIDYLGFKASDLYGKEIENTNGKLEITTSPVYIDNVSTKNFYQAISNSITTGYKEFDEKFDNEINKVPELKTKISNLNTFAESLKNVNTLDENTANSKMKEHFSLGNTIIKAYDDGRLDIEYVKLSSILDYLNTIGNAYEDLITVSAKTRITDLTSITNEVNEAKSIIENNTDIDIVYPNKIYKFSKDLLDTSSYVLGLDEENDIKTGLINSKATHAKYLADWSEEFSKIYIKGWLQGKVNIIKDENSKVYSKNEQLKSNTKISTKYNSLIENLNNLPSQTTSITKDTINSIYNQQYELINTIVDEFNDKKINISESEYQTLVTELLNISEQYKELFNAYITEDDIQNSTIENNINNVIDRYNENKDIDMTMCAELINNIKEIYNDKIQKEETSYNYLNKRRIQNTCTIISKMLENKIKETAQQEAQKIGIAYNIDQSTLTNKDVIAQIKLPNSKSSIESNPNNEKYTFTENGTKNITINIRGYKYNYNIKVTNIDKTPPQITGIEQGGKYKESITPQIKDANLSEVKLTKDGQEVENYKANTSITQEGIYQLTATDKAGNQTTINFVIAYPEDEKYKIENNTIKNVKGGTSVEILKGKLQVDEKYTIKRKDTEIQNSENIATGDILETESGNKYTLIVRGDLNKDGKVDIKDLVKMRKFLLLGNNLDESEEMAADTNIDGKEISIKDLVKMRIILLTQ